MIRGILAACIVALSGQVHAETIVIEGGRVLTMGLQGEIPHGTVLISDGRIVAVGKDIAIPADARRIDATGKIVTPGLVASGTGLGLIEVRQVPATDDRGTRNELISAAFDAGFGLNPDSLLIPVARLGGITSAISVPQFRDSPGREVLFAGQAAAISLGGPAILRKRGAAMVLELGEAGAERAGGARGAALVTLRAILAEVRDYSVRRPAFDRGETAPYILSRLDMDALIPVVEGRVPLLVSVNRASDIRDVLAIAREERLKIILEGAAEGWRVAREIAAARVPVVLNPVKNVPVSFEALGATLHNAGVLARMGVTIAIQGNGPNREREMRYNAGNAAANGLGWATALAAITINPARMFGIADRVGSIEPGKDADLVIWDGDPLDTLSRPLAVFIRGEGQPMASRATELRDRYMHTIKGKDGK